MNFLYGILILIAAVVSQEIDVEESSTWHQIEGKVYPPDLGSTENWQG